MPRSLSLPVARFVPTIEAEPDRGADALQASRQPRRVAGGPLDAELRHARLERLASLGLARATPSELAAARLEGRELAYVEHVRDVREGAFDPGLQSC
jgi:hypothetical protein